MQETAGGNGEGGGKRHKTSEHSRNVRAMVVDCGSACSSSWPCCTREEESDALNKRSFDLSNVDRRIETVPVVVDNISIENLDLTRQNVQFDCRTCRTPHIVRELIVGRIRRVLEN